MTEHTVFEHCPVWLGVVSLVVGVMLLVFAPRILAGREILQERWRRFTDGLMPFKTAGASGGLSAGVSRAFFRFWLYGFAILCICGGAVVLVNRMTTPP